MPTADEMHTILAEALHFNDTVSASYIAERLGTSAIAVMRLYRSDPRRILVVKGRHRSWFTTQEGERRRRAASADWSRRESKSRP